MDDRPTGPSPNPRARLRRRALLAFAGLAFLAGAWFGGRDEPTAASRFTEAWERQDFASMYRELTPRAQQRYSIEELSDAYLEAQRTATVLSIDAQGPGDSETIAGRKVVAVPVALETRIFDKLEEVLSLPLESGRIAWDPSLVFPGLRLGEALARETRPPARAAILGRGGRPLVKGPAGARTSPLGEAAMVVVGETGVPEDPTVAEAAERAGFSPSDAVGTSGLERAFNEWIGGRPGGRLLARDDAATAPRVLARSDPQPGKPLRTTIDPQLQRESVAALAGAPGGIAVLDARSGAVRALAGAAFSAPQPPGSTFKIVTTVAALEANAVKLRDQFPVQQGVNVEGRVIDNAHEEPCGGTFVQAFARSCNSVFAPLGPKIGNDGMVETAKRFGFNSRPDLYNASATDIIDPPPSTIPDEIGSDLDLAVTAIGQGRLLATPLQMASAAQTIAARGARSPTSIITDPSLRPSSRPVRVTSPRIARTVRRLMVGVVSSGTGRSAQVGGAQVAGKTGTAELGPKAEQGQITGETGEEPEQEVDAWFAGFAPAGRPRLVVAVMLVKAPGDGGEVAAPIAGRILAAGLG